MTKVADAIRGLVPMYEGGVLASVTAVDVAQATCDVAPLDGSAAMLDVRLATSSGGFLLVPKVGSIVLVLPSQEVFYVVAKSELSAAKVFADRVDLAGEHGQPIPLGDDLNQDLSSVVDELSALVSAIDAFALTQQSASVGPLAPLQAGFVALRAVLMPFQGRLNALKSGFDSHNSTKTFST